jgi:hypothetical protein
VLNYYQGAGPGAYGLSGKTRSDINPEIADRFQSQNRSPIFPERFLIAIVIAIGI